VSDSESYGPDVDQYDEDGQWIDPYIGCGPYIYPETPMATGRCGTASTLVLVLALPEEHHHTCARVARENTRELRRCSAVEAEDRPPPSRDGPAAYRVPGTPLSDLRMLHHGVLQAHSRLWTRVGKSVTQYHAPQTQLSF
jgi:hypothetical protein